MADFIVVERQNSMLGLSYGVVRRDEQGAMPICLCYNEAQAALVAAALTAYMPNRSPEMASRSAAQAPAMRARKPQATKASKPAARRPARKR